MKYLIPIVLLFATTANALPVTAKSYMVVDHRGTVVSEKNADQVRSIASITKLMTAVVVLNSDQNLDEYLKLNFNHAKYYHTRLPRTLKKLTRHQLLELALVKSDNFAAYTLCEHYQGGVDSCIADMNKTAREIGMTNTTFFGPAGLDSRNTSTARDLVKLVMLARHYPQITQASSKSVVKVRIKKQWWKFGNTNPLVKKNKNIIVSKTGYISASGGCIVMLLDTEVGERIVVLLHSKNTRTRIPEAAKIAVTVSHSDVSVD
jgi:D-alanyl-D-alanine endopeptidase (penicillin-binding protein 7)